MIDQKELWKVRHISSNNDEVFYSDDIIELTDSEVLECYEEFEKLHYKRDEDDEEKKKVTN